MVNLDPTQGSEIKKTRPCLVISPNEMNKYLQTIVVAPMTTSSRTYPTRVEVKHNKTKGWVVLDQIRCVDRTRIVKAYDSLTEKEITKVKAVMQETYVDWWEQHLNFLQTILLLLFFYTFVFKVCKITWFAIAFIRPLSLSFQLALTSLNKGNNIYAAIKALYLTNVLVHPFPFLVNLLYIYLKYKLKAKRYEQSK